MNNLTNLFNRIEKELENNTLLNLIGFARLYKGNDWKKYVKFSDIGYQRKSILCGKQAEFLILSWKKGQKSKIHDHPENGCILIVLQGKLREKRYCNKEISVMKETEACVGDVSYIDNSECYHDIEALEDSVSLHIYSPPNYHPKIFQ